MKIEYIKPLTNGWDRMVHALFKPFDITKWFVIGFTVFLAGLTDFHPRSSSSNTGKGGDFDLSDFFRLPEIAFDWLQAHPFWTALIIYGLLFLVVLIIILTYQWTYTEDKKLIAKFGEEYEVYKKEVPRLNPFMGLIKLLLQKKKI